MSVPLESLVRPLTVFAVALLIAFLLRHLLSKFLRKRIVDTHSFSLVLLNAIRVPSLLWCVVFGLGVAIRYSLPSGRIVYWANKGIAVFLIVSFSMVAAVVLVRMISGYGERKQMPFAVAGLSRTLTHVLVFSIAALMLLREFDISITPILTALGVGGLAVALALQDTLANLFAGIHILIEEPVRVGDFIRLSSNEEGLVRDIGWRTTRIHTTGNNIIVIPNTKITSGILTNFNKPDARVVAEISILVGHSADPNQVAEIAMNVAFLTAGVMEEPSPAVVFEPGVTPSHIEMKLLVHLASQIDRGPVT
ncbi:MAG: mechanosensitive ion channel family protein, partial [Bryobacteraceae bacterium]